MCLSPQQHPYEKRYRGCSLGKKPQSAVCVPNIIFEVLQSRRLVDSWNLLLPASTMTHGGCTPQDCFVALHVETPKSGTTSIWHSLMCDRRQPNHLQSVAFIPTICQWVVDTLQHAQVWLMLGPTVSTHADSRQAADNRKYAW